MDNDERDELNNSYNKNDENPVSNQLKDKTSDIGKAAARKAIKAGLNQTPVGRGINAANSIGKAAKNMGGSRNNRNLNRNGLSNNPQNRLGNQMPNIGLNNNLPLAPRNVKNGYSGNGYRAQNHARDMASSNDTRTIDSISDRLKRNSIARDIQKKKDTIRQGLNDRTPGLGDKADKVMKTEKGEKLLDKYDKAGTEQEGIEAVAKELEKKKKKKKAIITTILILLPILFLFLLVVIVFKNADTQIFSNQNGGTVESDNYGFDQVDTNIFAKYPGLFETIAKKVKEVSDRYKIELDQYLILATLLAPIDNGTVIPVKREELTNSNSCTENECYKFNGEYYNWSDFVNRMGEQTELLAKMQVLTYVVSKDKCKAGTSTMEQIADNDDAKNIFPWYAWINPVNWFKGYVDATAAEKNYVCIDIPNPANKISDVYVPSIARGHYLVIPKEDGSIDYDKDPNSGGVYYWNLVNENGFLFSYLGDYLSDNGGKGTDHDKYIASLPKILNIADYIYSYYDSIKKSCSYPKDDYYKIINSSIMDITITNPDKIISKYKSQYRNKYAPGTEFAGGVYVDNNGELVIPEEMSIPFEDQYIGGVILAEYNSGNDEALKAFAILARTEAVAVVGVDGKGTIENSSNKQNYNPTYTPEEYPRIARIVEETRGIVISDYTKEEVWHTEYDAFCPVRSTGTNGGAVYWLPEGQQNYGLDMNAYKRLTGKDLLAGEDSKRYLKCPCFQNADGRPHDDIINYKYIRYSNSVPTYAGGNPYQSTDESCWTETEYSRNGKTGWSYKPSGGHGRGASQYGLTYFAEFGYPQNALIRLFFKTANMRLLKSSIETGYCSKVDTMDKEAKNSSGSSSSSYYHSAENGGFTEEIGGNPLTKSIGTALRENGYTTDDLNDCIAESVNAAGYGTRDGVVAAGMSLLECTMKMTGGYTYPYDHYGGSTSQEDLNGKLGINTNWGKGGGTGCKDDTCRLGLNCATFVRWSMCNGGMNLCDRGSTFAAEMYGNKYFPGAIAVTLSPNFAVTAGETDITSASEAFDKIKPGDVLYYKNFDPENHVNHVMLVVGKSGDTIYIAENGRKTRSYTKSKILNSTDLMFGVLLLDNFYSDPSNQNSLSW